uniref:TELO2 interacting protein 2 n=1 Tax=Amphilophus citrinellus TaxID=61819 RepID=A0A3Q0R058_AMPCI
MHLLTVSLFEFWCVYVCQDQVWTSTASRAAAQHLQEALLSAGGWRDSAHLLMGDTEESRGILGEILHILQPQLTKCSFFTCVLVQVTRPSLSPHLPHLLPPSLLFSDHHRPENCMLGVRCLHHIVLNTLVLACLLDLLLILEKPPSCSSSRRKPCRHDDVLRLVLTHMEAENKVVLRRVYAAALPAYIDRMGVAVCRHLRRLERVVLGYLEVRDPPQETTRLKMLEALQKTARACRVNVLLRCLLRLLVDVSSDTDLCDSLKQQLMDQSAACIRLLDACSRGSVQVSHLLYWQAG